MTQNNSNNLWLFLEMLAKRRNLIVVLVFLACVTAAIISLLLPAWYEANALLLPPKNVTMPVGGVSQLNEVVSVIEGLNLPVMVTPSDVYARMLTSRTIADSVITHFDLRTRYVTDTYLDTYLELMNHTRFEVTEEGLLLIAVEDRDPIVAADMANAFVEGLERLNQQIASGRARQNREFIEERLNQVKEARDSARWALEEFQIEHRAVDFDQQTRLAVEEAIELKVTLTRLQIDLEMLEMTLGKDNPELIEKARRRDIVKEQLSMLEHGSGDSSFFSLPISSVPTLRNQYELLYSAVEVHEQLYVILLNQLEQAKLSENEELPTVSILDEARPPELRSRPRRTIIVGFTFLLSLIASVMLALFFGYFDRLREQSPEEYIRASFVVNSLLGWLPFFKMRSK